MKLRMELFQFGGELLDLPLESNRMPSLGELLPSGVPVLCTDRASPASRSACRPRLRRRGLVFRPRACFTSAHGVTQQPWAGRTIDASWGRGLSVSLAVVLLVLLFFLSIYAARGYEQPIGFDMPRYLWRTNCVSAHGLGALATCGPSEHAGLPNRVAYPTLASLLTPGVPDSSLTFAASLPSVLAVAIGLGWAALATSALRLGIGSFVVLALVIGLSPVVVSLTAPEAYVDMMIALVLASGGWIAAVAVLDRGRGMAPRRPCWHSPASLTGRPAPRSRRSSASSSSRSWRAGGGFSERARATGRCRQSVC